MARLLRTRSKVVSKQSELSARQGCIIWGSRVVVPKLGREVVLQELHEAHPGMTKTKSLARMYAWWPGINLDIEKSIRMCSSCQPTPSPAPFSPWQWPSRPFAQLHLDFAGPFENKMFLVEINAHSKWIEDFCVSKATSSVVIDAL